MKFIIKEKTDKNYLLVYENYEFLVVPDIETGYASISVNYLELILDEEGRITYLFGYEPLKKYEETEKFPEFYETKDLVAVLDNEPGSEAFPGNPTYKLVKNSDWPEVSEWPTYVNKKRGWVCIGDPVVIGKRMIEFAPSCVAALNDNNEMVAIWLHPVELPQNL